MHQKILSILTVLTLLLSYSKASIKNSELDVLSYHLTIEPDICKGTVSGAVVINFQVNRDVDSVIFNSGNLVIDSVSGDHAAGFKKTNHDLVIYMSERNCTKNEIVIEYHGYPK